MKERALFQVSFKVIVKNKNGEVLCLAYPPEMNNYPEFQNLYDLPGGRIDSDELEMSPLAVMKREIAEELGDDIRVDISDKPLATGIMPAQLTGSKKYPIFFVFFEGTYQDGEIKISDEHFGYEWINLADQPLEKRFVQGLLEGVSAYYHRKSHEI